MSNPPAGWYPDPTGQPNIIRFWNGEKWTNQTDHEDAAGRDAPPDDSHQAPSDPEPTQTAPTQAPEPAEQATPTPRSSQQPASQDPQQPLAPRQETAGPGLRSVQASGTGTPVAQPEDADSAGWWQPSPTPQLWDAAPAGDATQTNDGPRLRAVTPKEPAPEQGPTPAERAQATWGAPEIVAAPPEHWTQREVTDEQELLATTADVQPEEPAGNWTLKLAPDPTDEPTAATPIQPPATAGPVVADADAESAEGWSDVSWTAQPRFAPTPKEDVEAATTNPEPADATDAWPADTRAAEVPVADVRSAELQDAELQAADAAETAAQLQPDWGDQSGSQQDQQDQQASDQPSWGVEAQDQDDLQTPEQATAGPLWTAPQPDDATQEQPVWGAQGASSTQGTQQPGQVQLWGDQQAGQPEQAWGTQQVAAGTDSQAAAGDNGWGVGDQHGVQESGPWGQQPTAETQNGQQAGDQAWGGQSWPVQQPTDQQAGNGWGEGQPTAPPGWGATQQNGAQSWASGQQNGQQSSGGSWAGDQQGSGQSWGAGQQAWGDQQAPRAWGEDGNESWGGQTDLSTGVGQREKGKKKPKSPGGGGGPSGAKLPLIIGGGIAVVMLIVAAVFLIAKPGDDKKADPNPTGATQPTGSPTNQSSSKPGQSKNPKLHEGFARISSDAISFPRRNPPWSDRKRLVQQLLNSSGQHIVLQEKVNGGDDWSADIFVGGLGTGSGFNGDPKATAANLSVQLRTDMYGSIPVTYRTIANGAAKRTDKSGWFFQQTVTAKSAAVTDRVLTLTVAVFDLGDGTAVAYISGIPTNRPDLKAAESQAYKGINVG